VTSPRLPGYLPFSRSFQPSASALNTPVLHCHGTADQLVQLPWAEAGLQRLREVPMERQCGNMFWWKSEIIGNVSFFWFNHGLLLILMGIIFRMEYEWIILVEIVEDYK
jgi:hypothetical protein